MAFVSLTYSKADHRPYQSIDDEGLPAKRTKTDTVQKTPAPPQSDQEESKPDLIVPDVGETSDASETIHFKARIRPPSQPGPGTNTARLEHQLEKLQAEVHEWKNMFNSSEKLRIGNESRHREEVESVKAEQKRRYTDLMERYRVEKEWSRTLSVKHEVLRASDFANEAKCDSELIEATLRIVRDLTARRDARQALKMEGREDC